MFRWLFRPFFPVRGKGGKARKPEIVILLPPPPRRRAGGLISTLCKVLFLFAP